MVHEIVLHLKNICTAEFENGNRSGRNINSARYI